MQDWTRAAVFSRVSRIMPAVSEQELARFYREDLSPTDRRGWTACRATISNANCGRLSTNTAGEKTAEDAHSLKELTLALYRSAKGHGNSKRAALEIARNDATDKNTRRNRTT